MRILTLWVVMALLAAISTAGGVKEGIEIGGRRRGVDRDGGGGLSAQRTIPSRLPEKPPVEGLYAPILQLLACVCLSESDPEERSKERVILLRLLPAFSKPKDRQINRFKLIIGESSPPGIPAGEDTEDLYHPRRHKMGVSCSTIYLPRSERALYLRLLEERWMGQSRPLLEFQTAHGNGERGFCKNISHATA